jgi:DNA excision repair protein ERCC-3
MGEAGMNYNPTNPLIVQSDKTVLLEVENPLYEACRDSLAAFAELVKSPEYVHTYRISPLSLWNAAASGVTFEQVKESLLTYSKYDVPQNVIDDVSSYMGRYGRLKLHKEHLPSGESRLVLRADDPYLIIEITHSKQMAPFIAGQIDELSLEIPGHLRGHAKQALLKMGFPVEDLAGYVEGEHCDIELRSIALSGNAFNMRDYQVQSCDAFWAHGSASGGSGVLVLPCGAGKTVIGIGAMSRAQTSTLILATGITAARQWKSELLDKTTIPPDSIGEYSGDTKEIKPVTIATYQVMTYRKRKPTAKIEGQDLSAEALAKVEDKTGRQDDGKTVGDAGLKFDEEFPHLQLFNARDWGLIIYDEVHLLPAPVFRITAEIQARRRLGLTATLVREDGLEEDVFSLIGPKKYDVPWKVLERQGWIAEAICTEMRVPMDESQRLAYAIAEEREKFRIASENLQKLRVVETLLDKHRDDNVLIIGQYLDQLALIAQEFVAPIITGKTPMMEREKLYTQFKSGEIKVLIVSKVANFAIDLPDANIAIQVSGTFGSRQEEAQRLGRILRPKSSGCQAHFYTIVTRDSKEQVFAANRQLFLTEQGYRYEIVDMDA